MERKQYFSTDKVLGQILADADSGDGDMHGGAGAKRGGAKNVFSK
jgi:hypothetical protein